MTLARRLRDSRGEVCSLVSTEGAASVDVAREIDALVSALEGGALDVTPPGDRQRLGEALWDWVERSHIDATVRELRILHEWVVAGVTARAERLEREHEANARTEGVLRRILPNAGIVVVELDRDLRFRWIYDPVQVPDDRILVGRSLREFGGQAFVDQFSAVVDRVMHTGVGERTELAPSGHGDDGRERAEHILAWLEPTRDASGEVTGVLIASTDVTELKNAQIALARVASYREEMLAVLAHDLRNPLSSVLGLSRIHARDVRLPANLQRAFGQIDQAAERMQELIATLLDFSLARFGQPLPIARIEADLGDIARAVADELRSARPEHVIVVRVVGDTLGLWDPARLGQVLSNLVANALTHGAPGRPVGLDVDGADDRVVVRVSNHGPAIAPEQMAVLFEPFHRGGDPTTRPRGLGLGLYIVRQLVSAHGGTIQVESTDERGTVFSVDLPRGNGPSKSRAET